MSTINSTGDPKKKPSTLDTGGALQAITPLYLQLVRTIRESIFNGELAPGEQIPTEAELTARYGVSRITVRRAIQELTSEGLLIGIRGKGTFVNPSTFTGTHTYLFVHGLETGIDYPYTSLILNGICQQNRDRVHFRLEMLALPPLHLQSDQDDRDRVEDLLSHSPIHGIISLPRLRHHTLERLVERGMPVVYIGLMDPPPPAGVVSLDLNPCTAWTMLVEHLLARGRSRIGLIGQPVASSPTGPRELVIREVMESHGLPLPQDAYEPAPWGINGGYEAARRLLQRRPDLDAIMASDDLQALGAMQAARDAGRRIGDDLAVTGMGNILGEHSHCGLTTIDLQLDGCGRLATQCLRQLLRGETLPPVINCPLRLLIRDSA